MRSKENILCGPAESENLGNGAESLGEYCLEQLRNAGDMVILANYPSNVEITADKFLTQSIRVAQCLTQYGIRAGDHVGIYSENHIEFCSVIMGTIFIGATVVPISPFFTQIEFNHAYELTKPSIFFVSSKNLKTIQNVAEQNNSLKHIIVFGESKTNQSFDEFLSTVDKSSTEEFSCEPQDRNSVAVILSSSGTTGLPKGAELTQLNLLSSAENMAEAFGVLPFILIPMPLSYVTGFMFTFAGLVKPVKTILLEKCDPYEYLKCVDDTEMPLVFFNQTLMTLVANTPLEEKFNLHRISILMYGGSAISQNIIQKIEQKLPNIVILQVYGITECFSISSQNFENLTPGSVGVLSRGVQGKVVNTSGETVGPNELGELMFKTSRLFKGYAGNQEETKKSFDDNGFFHTGDIGYYNENGEWFIVDRIKELIKYNGLQVYPAEIESVLMGHPSVYSACVVALPDEECGEKPLAFIVRKDKISAKEIIEYAKENLSFPQYLRGGIVFIDKMPETSTGSGKSFRKVLKEMSRIVTPLVN